LICFDLFQVAWIRASDAHILTVEHEVFISDPRFTAIHQTNSSTWTLQIKSVQPNDAGKYECQISTLPKMSHFLHLSVIVPKVRIFGDRDIFVKSSSTVQLKCVVSQSLVAPTYIEWRHNDHHLPLATSALGMGAPKGARLQTTPPEHIAEGTTMSTLTILNADMEDSGKYTCLPAQLEAASVNLHVLETDLPALMQTSDAASMMENFSRQPLTLAVVLTAASFSLVFLTVNSRRGLLGL
jgi:neurotrimin